MPEKDPFVNKSIVSPISPVVDTAPALWLRAGGIVVTGSAFVALCAHIALPLFFTPVPLSMAPFGVLLIGLALSPRLAAATLAAYLTEGAMGLPVFSSGSQLGFAHLIGPTGGYLLAYPCAAFVISWISRLGVRSFSSALAGAATGSVVILACGASWMAILTHASATSVLALSVVPFLPGDALKVIAAATIVTGFRRLRRATA
jgi:biotin transport system substrate-specific component